MRQNTLTENVLKSMSSVCLYLKLYNIIRLFLLTQFCRNMSNHFNFPLIVSVLKYSYIFAQKVISTSKVSAISEQADICDLRQMLSLVSAQFLIFFFEAL